MKNPSLLSGKYLQNLHSLVFWTVPNLRQLVIPRTPYFSISSSERQDRQKNRLPKFACSCRNICFWCGPDGTSSKTSASGAGGMGFKSRADQISHTLLTTRHRCNLDVRVLTQSRGVGHRSLVTSERVLSKYNED